MLAELVGLALLWGLWCLLHSGLIHPPVAAWLQRRLGSWQGWQRIGYNLLALATLVPLWSWTLQLDSPSLLQWSGPWQLLQGGLWMAGAALLWGGARSYPLTEFTGLAQLRRARRGEPQPPAPALVRTGLLGRVRHPWYLAGLLLLWSRDLRLVDLLINLVLSGYLVIGAHLEERKLLSLYGAAYQRYRRQVPMLLPRLRRPRSD